MATDDKQIAAGEQTELVCVGCPIGCPLQLEHSGSKIIYVEEDK